jgi:alpha/beta superfamily hydrolase
MTNHLTSNLAPVGRAAGESAHDQRTRRPVKLVEHPAFRGRRERRVTTATVARLGADGITSLAAAARSELGLRVRTTSTLEAA